MKLAPLASDRRSVFPPWCQRWIALIGICLGFFIAVECLANDKLITEIATTISEDVIIYGNLLLLASTILYLLHLRAATRTIGLWATGLATVGALALLAGLAVRTTATYLAHDLASGSLTGLSDLMTLSSAITVILYLVMERMYRTRSAGAFVMPIVATAVLFVAFGKSDKRMDFGEQHSALLSYWTHAHALANFIAYGAFAVAAALVLVYLLRPSNSHQTLAQPDANHPPLELTKIEKVMDRATSVGFFLLAISTVFDMILSDKTGEYSAWNRREVAAAIILIGYALYLYLSHIKKWHGRKLASSLAIGFLVALFSFFSM